MTADAGGDSGHRQSGHLDRGSRYGGLPERGAALKAEDIHLVGGIVPHGGHSVQGEALEAWWSRNRDGNHRRNWGGWGMDYAARPWQDIMQESARWLAESFGFEGLRIDVAEGSGPNWGSPRGSHASFSTLGGALELSAAIREGLAKGGAEYPLLIPETFVRPEFFALSPIGYGHETWMLFAREIAGMVNDPAGMATRLEEYFERERGSLPPGARQLRYVRNHDAVAEKARAITAYGAGLARALYGVCLMVEGIPLIYQEEEIGSFQAFRAMHLARKRIPEFVYGEADYTTVDFAPEVFACLRRGEAAAAIGLSNLSGRRVEGTLRLPENVIRPARPFVVDGVTGVRQRIEDNSVPWSLAPYATALLRVGRELEDPPEQRPQAAATTSSNSTELLQERLHLRAGKLDAELRAGPGPWRRLTQDGERAVFESPGGRIEYTFGPDDCTVRIELCAAAAVTPSLFVRNAEQWAVSGRTALLEDRVLRRRHRFPPDRDYAWERPMCWGRACAGRLYNGVCPSGRGRVRPDGLLPGPVRPAGRFNSCSGTPAGGSRRPSSARGRALPQGTERHLVS